MIVDISEVALEMGLSSSITDEERALITMGIQRAEGAVIRFLGYDPSQRTRTEYYPSLDPHYQESEFVWEVNDTQAYQRRLASAATSELQMKHLPIRTSTAIELWLDYDGRSGTLSGAFSDKKAEGTDYWANYDGYDSDGNKICRDGILRSIGTWPTTPNSVKVTYVAGYSAKEFRNQDTLVFAGGIWEAALDEAVLRCKRALALNKKKTRIGWAAGPLTSERLGDYSYTADASVAQKLFGGQWDLQGGSVQKLREYRNDGYLLAS